MNNINRHNYETFFLLYVDNELSAEEKKAVEKFVLDNLDLKPELDSLLQTTLTSESIRFNARNQLYKNEVEQAVQMEQLLLHLDEELDSIAAEKINISIATDSSVQNEWNILQQTRLDANDKIVFKNKEILFHHTPGRVITIRFRRIAIAAAILAACFFNGMSLLKKGRHHEDIATVKKIKPVEEKQPVSNQGTNRNTVDSLQKNDHENIAFVKDKEQNNLIANPVKLENTTELQKETGSKDHLVKVVNNISRNTPLENINNEKSNESNASLVINKNKKVYINTVPVELANKFVKEKISAPATPVIDYNSIPAKPDSYALSALNEESAPGNNNMILYLNEEDIARSKIGGLFRRVKRTIERNTNIKTGNGVKIGGFEFALNK